jgi:hypothetical protein
VRFEEELWEDPGREEKPESTAKLKEGEENKTNLLRLVAKPVAVRLTQYRASL